MTKQDALTAARKLATRRDEATILADMCEKRGMLADALTYRERACAANRELIDITTRALGG